MLPIFYINLGTRPDRRKHVESELSRLGLVGQRVEAVTKEDFDKPPSTRLTSAEIACSRSHRKIWKMLVDRNIAAALILEDDVLLSSELPALLNDAKLLEPEIEMLQLENRNTSALIGKALPTAAPAVSRHRLMSSSLGSAAYLITRGLASKLLARKDLDQHSLDILLFGRRGGVIYDARVFQAVPAVATQLDQTHDGRSGAGLSDLDVTRQANGLGSEGTIGARLRRLGADLHFHYKILHSFGPSGDLWGARQLRLPVQPDLQRLM